MTPGAAVLFGKAISFQFGIQVIEARCLWHWRQKSATAILDQVLDLALVVPLSRASEAIAEQIVAQKLGERLRALAPAITADLRNRQLGVVIEDRLRHATEERKRADVTIQECFRRLRRINLHERHVRIGQVHVEDVELAAHAADHADGFAEIHLRMPGRMMQRYELLRPPLSSLAHIVGDNRDATRKPVLVPQTLENPLRRVALLPRCLPIRFQDRVDNRDKRIELRFLRRNTAPIPGRLRKTAHLRDSVTVQAKNKSGFASAVALNQHETPYCRVSLHGIHLPALPSESEKESLASDRILLRRSSTMPPLHWPSIAPVVTDGRCIRSQQV